MNTVCQDFNDKGKPCYHYIKDGFCKLPNHFRCIEYIRRKSPVLSPSYIHSYLRCRRKFYWEYIKGLELVKDNYYKLTGELIHFYLSELHSSEKTVDDVAIMEKARELADRIAALFEGYEEETGVPEDVIRVQGLMLAYRDKGFADIKGKTEVKEVRDVDGVTLKGIADLIPDDGDTIYDFKYTSKMDWFTLFTTKLQASFYLVLFPEKKSITFRLINRPALRMGKNETKDQYKERVYYDVVKKPNKYVKDITFYRSEYDLDLELKTIKSISDEIKNNIDRDIEFFYQNPSGCYFPGPCDYLPICESGVIPDDMYVRREVEEGDL